MIHDPFPQRGGDFELCENFLPSPETQMEIINRFTPILSSANKTGASRHVPEEIREWGERQSMMHLRTLIYQASSMDQRNPVAKEGEGEENEGIYGAWSEEE